MDPNYPPDREAMRLLALASDGLHKAAEGLRVPYLIAVQVADPRQPNGVASHVVSNLEPATMRAALLDLLERLAAPDELRIVTRL